jgi:hypothetical protein
LHSPVVASLRCRSDSEIIGPQRANCEREKGLVKDGLNLMMRQMEEAHTHSFNTPRFGRNVPVTLRAIHFN